MGCLPERGIVIVPRVEILTMNDASTLCTCGFSSGHMLIYGII
jgi:hypothetical protein